MRSSFSHRIPLRVLELPATKPLHEDLVKKLTGGEKIPVRTLFKGAFRATQSRDPVQRQFHFFLTILRTPSGSAETSFLGCLMSHNVRNIANNQLE